MEGLRRVGIEVQAHSFSAVGVTYGYGRSGEVNPEPVSSRASDSVFQKKLGDPTIAPTAI